MDEAVDEGLHVEPGPIDAVKDVLFVVEGASAIRFNPGDERLKDTLSGFL
jgi:hypothetical protein